jgi:hypothetical protein
MSTTVTPNGLRVLAALRAASVLRREPGPLTPDGYEHWFTLGQLAEHHRLDVAGAGGLAPLSSAVRGLYKKHLVAMRTQFTVTRFRITEAGALALAEAEAKAGVADLAAAELDLAQAEEDIRQAQKRREQALARLRELPAGKPRLPSLMIVLKSMAGEEQAR